MYLCLPPCPCLLLSSPVSLTHTSILMHADIRKHPLLGSTQNSPYLSWALTLPHQHFILFLGAEPRNLPDWKPIICQVPGKQGPLLSWKTKKVSLRRWPVLMGD